MAENDLESIRRQIKEAEERLKSGEPNAGKSRVSQRNIGGSSESEPIFSLAGDRLQFLHGNFCRLIESSNQAIILVDKNGRWELMNSRLPEWLGYSNDEFSKMRISNIFEQKDANRFFALLPQWLNADMSVSPGSFHLCRKSGERAPVQISSHPLLNDRGERIACLVFENVQSQLLESQVGGAKALLDAIMRNGAIPFLLLQKDGIIMEANEAASKWLGIGAEKFPAMRLSDFISPSSRKDFEFLFNRALQLQSAIGTFCKFRRRGGAEFAARISMAGVLDGRGVVHRVVGTLDRIGAEGPIAESSEEWSAYGQMTPDFLAEISGFIADSVRGASDRIQSLSPALASESEAVRFLQSVERARSLLAGWAESAEFIDPLPFECSYQELVKHVLNARRAELQRWGIKAEFEDASAEMELNNCPRVLYPAILHILQSCIEQLREGAGMSQLTIRIQNQGERVETTFLCAGSPESAAAPETGAIPYELLRSKNLELRAAQRLLDSIGGSLVLENISETQCAVRMNLNISTLSAGRNLHEQSQV